MSMEINYKLYVHINKINGKRYYGITGSKKVEKRWRNGRGYKFWIDKDGKRHGNEHFWNSICKYGWDSFEHIVLFEGLTKDEAELMEKCYIALYNTRNPSKGYNQTDGGEGGNGAKRTEETRKKISEAKKGELNPNYGKHLSEEHRKKISEANKGREVTEETRKKLSEASKGCEFSEEHRKKLSEANKGKYEGENNPMYGKHHTEETRKKLSEAKKDKYEGENNPFYGKHHTEETRKKISEANKGREVTEETRKKISEANKGREVTEETRKKISEANKGKNHPRATKIYCEELDMYFDTVREASEYVGCSRSNISAVLNPDKCNKTAGGYHWVYAKDK